MDDAEPGAQAAQTEQPGASRCADQREGLAVDVHRSRVEPRVDGDIDPEIFHCRVDELLDRDRQAVDFVDEEHVSGGSSGSARSPGRCPSRARGPLVACTRLPISLAITWASVVLPRPGRPMQQHMLHRLAALANRLNRDRQTLDQLALTDVLLHARRDAARQAGLRPPPASSAAARSGVPSPWCRVYRLEWGIGRALGCGRTVDSEFERAMCARAASSVILADSNDTSPARAGEEADTRIVSSSRLPGSHRLGGEQVRYASEVVGGDGGARRRLGEIFGDRKVEPVVLRVPAVAILGPAHLIPEEAGDADGG